jgi:AraC-like DNA-binding protein
MAKAVAKAAIDYKIIAMMALLSAEPVALSASLPIRVERVRRGPGSPAPARFAHFHQVEEIVLFDSICGSLFANDSRFELVPGCGVRLPSMTAHDFDLSGGRAEWTLIQFYHDFAVSQRPADVGCVHFATPERKRLKPLCKGLAEAVSAGQAPEARCYLELIMLMFDRARPIDQDGVAPSHALSRFRPFLERVRDEPSAALSLPQAASLCHLSPAYFSRLFREVFGRGFSNYMTQMRLDHAALRLASTQAPVSEIGFAAGFTSHAYFSARFRERFGLTPTQFRARDAVRGSVRHTVG